MNPDQTSPSVVLEIKATQQHKQAKPIVTGGKKVSHVCDKTCYHVVWSRHILRLCLLISGRLHKHAFFCNTINTLRLLTIIFTSVSPLSSRLHKQQNHRKAQRRNIALYIYRNVNACAARKTARKTALQMDQRRSLYDR